MQTEIYMYINIRYIFVILAADDELWNRWVQYVYVCGIS